MEKNDRKARFLIFTFSVIVFAVIVLLSRIRLNWQPGFDIHVFARVNAAINSVVALLLLSGLFAVKLKKYNIHKWVMIISIIPDQLYLSSSVGTGNKIRRHRIPTYCLLFYSGNTYSARRDHTSADLVYCIQGACWRI